MQKAEKIREMLKMQLESGLSVKEFCFNQGIGHATFYNRKKWLAAYDKEPMLAPITIKPAETTRNCFAQESSLQKEELQPSYETNNQMQVL